MTIEEDSAWVDALAGRVGSVRAESSDSMREASLLRERLLAQEFLVVTDVPTIDAGREEELIARARAAGLLSESSPRTRRRRFAAGLQAAAMVILAVGGAGLWWSTRPPPETLRGVVGGTVHLEARDPPALKRRLIEELTAARVTVSGYERFGHLGIDADLPIPISPDVARVLERHHIPVPVDGALVVEIDPPNRR
jgi:hypothetical protein